MAQDEATYLWLLWDMIIVGGYKVGWIEDDEI